MVLVDRAMRFVDELEAFIQESGELSIRPLALARARARRLQSRPGRRSRP
jgi:hypothetical protein